MHINHDPARRVVLDTASMPWSASPMPGVERRMLDRVGAEVARATSIVRYAPGSRFPVHRHGGGEEILVLEGVFSDETGDNPAGSYLRNPPGTAHAPFSEPGCVILVKLWQFAASDRESVRLDTQAGAWRRGAHAPDILPLHAHGGVRTFLLRWPAHAAYPAHVHPGGEELLVLEGSLHDEAGDYPAGTWLRNPPGSRHAPRAGASGALLYMKTGHLVADWLPLPA